MKMHMWHLTCATDAIIPSWAYLLVATYLTPFTKKIVVGNLELLETQLFQEIIDHLDISSIYVDKPIIIKGCVNKPVFHPTASIQFIEKLTANS